MRSSLKNQRGITLVEALVYLALFGMIFLTMVEFFISMNQGNKQAKYSIDVEKSSIFVLEHLKESFDQATVIDPNLSTFDVDNGVLRLTTGSGYIEYRVSGQHLQIDRNGTTNNITTNGLTMTVFKITKVLNRKNEIVGIKLNFTIRSTKYPSKLKSVETTLLL